MNRDRLLELALEALRKRKAEVDYAIAHILELQGKILRSTVRSPELPTLVVVKRRSKTAAERKAQSRRMTAYWAAKRVRTKLSEAAGLSPARAKRGPKSAAGKEALSLKSKEARARRKARAAKKADRRHPKG